MQKWIAVGILTASLLMTGCATTGGYGRNYRYDRDYRYDRNYQYDRDHRNDHDRRDRDHNDRDNWR
jgi:hypothetical protein